MLRSLARSSAFACAVAAILATFVCSASAQSQQLSWFALDNSAPGTPAGLVFDANGSNTQASFFDVFVHGFWYETRMSPTGQPFTRMVFPGLSPGIMPGQPFLPYMESQVAFPPGASVAMLGPVQVLSSASALPPSPCWPTPIAEQDHPGSPEQFVAPDPAIYQGQVAWPPSDGDAREAAVHKGAVMGATFRLYPVHWNPATGALEVMTHVRYQISHPGNGTTVQPITKDASRYAARRFLNWTKIATYYPPNASTWTGDYLVVTQVANGSDLLPLITQKAARGYAVTVHFITTPEVGNAVAIRTVVENWYASTPSWHDHYALLVGDVSVIPFGSKGTIGTDDLYADADGDGADDLDPEVMVGRLSINSTGDLANQVGKILQYENAPVPFFDYARDLLIANFQDAPGKYEGCLESVAGYGGYSTAPTFTKLYGSVAGKTNATISAEVNAGYGIVTYRGHGDWDEWWNWNVIHQAYFNSDVDLLTNTVAPVVWSIACNTYDLRQEDCFAEHWMALPAPHGAVSFYGASEPSDTDPNHVLTRGLHRAVFEYDMTKQALAIAFGEKAMADTGGYWNAWRYGLLGDPDMDVRRESQSPFTILRPSHLPISGSAAVPFQIVDPGNRPLPGALVGAYKPPNPNAPAAGSRRALPLSASGTLVAEFQDNHYTDAGGNVTLNGATLTSGWLYFAVRLDDGTGQGSAILDSIPVGSQSGVSPGDGLSVGFGAFPNVTHAGTEFRIGLTDAAAGTIRVCDVAGRVMRTLAVERGARSVRWDGTMQSGARATSGVYFARYVSAGPSGATLAVARLAIII